MSQFTRVPAWKRLGLKLQKDQSPEEHTPQKHASHHTDQSGERRMTVNDSIPSATEPIETPNSKLGKRKHQHSSAESQEKSAKRTKSTQMEEPGHGTAEHVPTANTPMAAHEQPAPTSAPVLAPKVQPTGDPNYRKKKEKGSKRNKRDGQASQPSPSIEKSAKPFFESHPRAKAIKPILRTPSLSPGRLDPAATLLASTETEFPPSPPKRSQPSSSPPAARTDRRKSVTFTPDTKTVDGNSAQNLFKKWVQEQKSTEEFTEAEVAQFEPPPKVHPANGVPAPTPATASKDARKANKAKKGSNTETGQIKNIEETKETSSAASGANKKKDPSRYLDYLTQYHTDRPNWKFNKAKQNDVLSNALNVFRIPEEYSDALVAYVSGLQGAGVIERLRQQCITTIKEIDALGTDSEDQEAMEDTKARQAAQDEAMKEHVTKQRRRRRTEADMENFAKHPYPEAFVRRMKKGRAEALQKALGYALPAPSPVVGNKRPAPDRKGPKAKKRRTEVDISSDETTDSSSSEESSTEEESSDDESDSDSAESSDGESESESSSGDSKTSGSESEGDSDSNND